MKYSLIILAIYAAIFSILAIRNHQLYQTFGWDLGFFDQLLWQASRGNLNFVSTIGDINILGDHFQPMIYLLAPLYWIWDDVRVILIAQVFLVTAAAIPLFLLAVNKTGSKLIGIAIALSYLLFSGTQFTITNEFHQSAFIPLFLSLGLYWIEIGQEWKGLAAMFALLLVREEMGLLMAALGIMYILRKVQKGVSLPPACWRGKYGKETPYNKNAIGLILLAGGFFGFFLLINVILPVISSQHRYIHYGYGSLGNTPDEVFVSAVKNPISVVTALVLPPVKINQVIQSLISFGGLPILSPTSLIPVFEQYTVRFLDDRNIHRWINNNHYSVPLGPLLAFGAILAIRSIRSIRSNLCGRKGWTFKSFKYLAGYLTLVSLATAVWLKTPIWSVFKPQLYFTPEWVRDADRLVAAVPAEASVAVNNSLAPHLTHRDKLYLLPEVKDAEYIAVDLAEGPNKHAPWPQEKMREYIDGLVDVGDWEVQQRFGESILLTRILR